MTTRTATREAPGRRAVRLGASAGMVGPAVFVGVFTAQDLLRSGYHPRSMYVSELSLGPHGWVQVTSFLVAGLLILLFGRALAAHLREGVASGAGPALVQVMGASLMASGPFATDPSAMFDQVSTHGVIHGVLGAVFFALAPVTCWVFYRRFGIDAAWRPLARWTLAAVVVLTLGIVAMKVGQTPSTVLFSWKGLVQRVVLVTFMAWLFAVAARTRQQASRDPAG